MTHTTDAPRFEAFEQLLEQPDPRDLPRRAHILRWEGEPDRRSTRLPPLMAAWLQRHYLEVDGAVFQSARRRLTTAESRAARSEERWSAWSTLVRGTRWVRIRT